MKTELKVQPELRQDVKDLQLAGRGLSRIEWAARQMPVLESIAKEFEKEKPLKGLRIGACLHVTTETANLMVTLKRGGAEAALCASNPLSTQDDVAASLVADSGIPVFAKRGEDSKTYHHHLNCVLDFHPDLILDDGADLHGALHTHRQELLDKIRGGTEETTTGVIRLRSMEKEGVLRYPVIGVNDARTKFLFDNRYGTGQSTLDGIFRATNLLLAGKKVVVAGYGWCGRGIAMRARGMGAQVIVTEVDALRALEAVMDGYEVMTMKKAAEIGEIFITATGNAQVISKEHLLLLREGAVLCNAGHFNVEIDVEGLEKLAAARRVIRECVEEFKLPNGRRVYLLGEGRLINLVAAEGHPASVMDMSFANQALSAEYFAKLNRKLEPRVYPVPENLDRRVAKLKLQSMSVQIDSLTKEQARYLSSWDLGT